MEHIKVKPAEGRLVRLDGGYKVPSQGMNVLRTAYINRRINDGDLEIISPEINDKNEEPQNTELQEDLEETSKNTKKKK